MNVSGWTTDRLDDLNIVFYHFTKYKELEKNL